MPGITTGAAFANWETVLTELLAFVCPLAVAWGLTALLLRWAPSLGLIDQPSARKVHTQPTPRGGGLAIYAGMVATTALLPTVRAPELLTILGLGLAIVILGLWDDLHPLPWQFRLGVQAVTAAVVVWMWPAERGWLVRVFGVCWIVGLINAFNMLDNMDALSAGVAWVAAAAFAGIRWLAGDPAGALPLLMLMGATAGFLWFNRPPARIFMGDAGSTFLGFFLAVGSLEFAFFEHEEASRWLAPLCVLAVPCYDLVTVVTLRMRQGRSPFHADKQHLSHRLVLLGLTSPVAVLVIHVCALASGLAGLAVSRSGGWPALFIGLQLACWWVALSLVEYCRHYRTP